MKVTFVLKDNLEILPPVIPRVITFADHGFNVSFICTKMSESNRGLFESKGIRCLETRHNNTFRGKRSKIKDWLYFQKSVLKLLDETNAKEGLLYICSADTALALGSKLLTYSYVLQSNELYDRFARYKNGLKKYVQGAKAFVVPEYVRANICMYWYSLKKMPYVIPNYPYLTDTRRDQQICDDQASKVIEALLNKKIVIYQGYITYGDRSLNAIAEAMKEINDDSLVFVLMGINNNHSYEKIKEIYCNTYYIPFVKPPYHLQITSHAHIGVLSYDRVSLNNMFCAPNKIYEYSAFGIPMIGNNIPGLRDTINVKKMGMCADFENIGSVTNSIKDIIANYEEYSNNARLFYETSSYHEEMLRLMNSLEE